MPFKKYMLVYPCLSYSSSMILIKMGISSGDPGIAQDLVAMEVFLV